MFLTSYLDFTKTIIPLALMASESIAHSASWAIDSWAIDSEPIRARVIIVKEPFIRSIMRFSLFSLSRFMTTVRVIFAILTHILVLVCSYDKSH